MMRNPTVVVLAAMLCALLAIGLFAGVAGAAPTVIFADSFESAFSGWTQSGHPVWNTAPPVNGTHDVKLPPRNSSIQRTVSTIGWQDVTVSFSLGATLTRKGAYLRAYWFNGSTWATLVDLGTGDQAADGALHSYGFTLPATANNNSKVALRFRLSGKTSTDAGYVDDVAVSAGSRYLYTLTLAGANGSVKVNGVEQALPYSGQFDYGATVVLQAVADDGYHFTGWSGGLTGDTSPAIITMSANRAITASFAVNTYRLAIGSGTGHGSVNVDGVLQTPPWSGTYDFGTSVMLEAVPDSSYHFSGWAGGLTGTTNPAFVTMDGDQSVSAGFASDMYVLLLSGDGSGSVKVDGVEYALPNSVTVEHGSTVALEAEPATGWHFTAWSGAATGTTAATSLLVDSDRSVTAGFAIDQYSLNLTGTGNGAVRVDGVDQALPWSGSYNYGDTVTVEAVPAAGSHFISWSGGLGAANPVVVTIDGQKDIAASFGLNTYTLAIGGTNGTVKVNGGPKALPWSGMFSAGEVVNLEAVAAEGYTFASWSGDLAGPANPTTITMSGNRTVTADFSANIFTLTMTGAHGSLLVDATAQTLPYSAGYDYGAVVTLEAVPDTGYLFSGWSGGLTGAANPVDVTISGNTAITADFTPGQYTLSVTGTGGTISVDGVPQTLPWTAQYGYGTTVTVEAVKDPCTNFYGWTGDLVGWSNPAVIIVDGNKALTAEFGSIEIFGDVSCDTWGAAEIAACYEAGIVKGLNGGTVYQPAESVTRAQMAVFISRALAGGDEYVPTHPATVTFTDDVKSDYWAYNYVEYAVIQGVVKGYDATHYSPEGIVDRGQLAVFIARAMGWVNIADPMNTEQELFSDVPAGFWSGTAIKACMDNGVVHGYDNGTYRPSNPVTRDQMAVFIARAWKLPI